MNDNGLINLLATQLESASAKAGWNYVVVQKQQPTQEGIPEAATIFFEKLFDLPYGWPQITDTFDEAGDVYQEVEKQLLETRFQISALVPQDPTNTAIPTPSDVVNYLQQFMSARATRTTLRTYNVGTLRVTEVRNPYFEDDKHRMEAAPSFDITLTHDNSIEFDVGVVRTAVPTEIIPV